MQRERERERDRENNPKLFLELAQDENVGLRNMAIKATEANIITLSQDQRTFSWTSNGRKLMSVPFDENPYSAMAAYFKTDEGVEVYRSIEKKFNQQFFKKTRDYIIDGELLLTGFLSEAG